MAMQMNEIDPQVLEEILSSGAAIGGAQDKMTQQQALAKRLRSQAGSPALMQAGGTQVSASPFAHIASAMGNVMANRADQSANAAQGEIRTAQAGQNKATMDAIRKALMRMGGAPAQTMPAAPTQDIGGSAMADMYLGQ
jgi:hypothetical protein